MRTLDISEAATQFPELIDQVEREPLVIERDGDQVAFIVSPAEYATTRRARGQAVRDALHAIHDELDTRMTNGEFNQSDLEELARSLDRKAS